jgi:phytanoyl-CoA hydroxylase
MENATTAPSSGLVESPTRNRERFSPAEVEQFQRQGFFIARGLARGDLVSRMLAATLAGLAGEIPPIEYEADLNYPGAPSSLDACGGRTVRRLKRAHSRHPVFTEWLSDPPLVERMRQLLGPEVVVPLAHHNCVMTKQPIYSSDTGWHQDIRYWSFSRPDLVSAWLALGEETIENGCLRLVPGTHRMQFDRSRFDDALFLRTDVPENAALLQSEVTAELDAGDVLFFHCRAFHAATRNFGSKPKYSVVFTFRPLDNPPVAGSRSASFPEILLSREAAR